jgi:hypothetical protein
MYAVTGTLEEAVYKRQIYKQQQANTVLEGAEEARYFEGVQVVRGCQGPPGGGGLLTHGMTNTPVRQYVAQ